MRTAAALMVLFAGFYVGRPAPASVSPADEVAPAQRGSCGDYQCNPPEDCNSCPRDCGPCQGRGPGGACGDYQCNPPEDCRSCPTDCGPCGGH